MSISTFFISLLRRQKSQSCVQAYECSQITEISLIRKNVKKGDKFRRRLKRKSQMKEKQRYSFSLFLHQK